MPLSVFWIFIIKMNILLWISTVNLKMNVSLWRCKKNLIQNPCEHDIECHRKFWMVWIRLDQHKYVFEIKVVKQFDFFFLFFFFLCTAILNKNGEHRASILPLTLKFVYEFMTFLICGLDIPSITASFVTLKTVLQTITNTAFKWVKKLFLGSLKYYQ